jgi:hypothetical protein
VGTVSTRRLLGISTRRRTPRRPGGHAQEAFGIGTNPLFLPAVQAHWRAGTSGNPNILDGNATAVTNLVAFLRTIDDTTTPFPAADLAPDDPTFADAGALCDCQKTPPLGVPALDCAP